VVKQNLPIKSDLTFIYNGLLSTDMGLKNVTVDGGIIDEPFVAEREIIETEIRGRDRPYFSGVKLHPRILDLKFVFTNGFDATSLKNVRQWLCQTYYKPMIFSNNPDKVYYCLLHSDPRLLHNGLSQGYVSCQFRCDGPYAYSAVTRVTYDYTVGSPNTFIFNNTGDINCKPIIAIKKVTAGGAITFDNLTDGSQFGFDDMDLNETITTDCENEIITSDVVGNYRYSNLVGDFLSIPIGENSIQVTGACQLTIDYQFKYL
jgi:predicted phage tail component-like protein